MSEIQQSATPRPRQLTGKLAEIAKAVGLPDELPPPEPEGEAYAQHAEFARRVAREGERVTDCEGQLRIDDRNGFLLFLTCDRCGYATSTNLRHHPEYVQTYLLERSGIPEAYLGKEFDKTIPEAQQTLGACRLWVKQFKADPLPAIGLHGPAGRGKTHLLCLMVETLIKRYAVEARYRPATQMFDELRGAIDRGTLEAVWEPLLNADVLALDDLGAGASSEWTRDRLFALVDYRISKEKPLLIATNNPPQQWDELFGERAASRLRGMVVPLKLEGPDRRVMGVQQTLTERAA